MGRRIEAVDRRGKYLLIDLDAARTLAIHLRMTGRLHWQAGPPDESERFLRARFHLDDGSTLTFGDMRRFGRAWIVDGDAREREAYWRARVGVEPLSPRFTARRAGASSWTAAAGRSRRCSSTRRWSPGSATCTSTRRSSRRASTRCARPARSTTTRSGGCTGRSATGWAPRWPPAGASIDSYRDGLGEKGSMQDLLRVHLHAGEPCPRCGTTIRKTRVAQRGTYWCPTCQPEPAPW